VPTKQITSEEGHFPQKHRAEVDLIDLFRDVWGARKLIFGLTLGASSIAIAIALWLPNVYESSTILRPKNSQAGMSDLIGQYGGLAKLAGVSLPPENGQQKTSLALEILKSRRFASEFVERHKILPQFFAAKDWNWDTQKLSLDPSIYDDSGKTWIRRANPPRSPRPSAAEIHDLWMETFSAAEDKDTGFVRLSLKHRSPVLAKLWLDLVILDINEELRAQDLEKAERAILYLEKKMKETQISEIRNLLSGLLRNHMESRMLATIEEDYAFSVIDPPAIEEKKAQPNRVLICISGFFIGLFSSIFLALILRELDSQKNQDN
jgi:uncharacterized protein involved in exopolysaccharide biosynthesis